MGRTLHEVFRNREVRDHRTGGTVVALNPPDTGSNRDPEIDVLRLVQPIPGGRDRSSGGWQAETAADLEQDLKLHKIDIERMRAGRSRAPRPRALVPRDVDVGHWRQLPGAKRRSPVDGRR